MYATFHTLFLQLIKYLLKFLPAVSGTDDTIHLIKHVKLSLLIKHEKLKKSLLVCDDREYNLSSPSNTLLLSSTTNLTPSST